MNDRNIPTDVYVNCLKGYPPRSPLVPELKERWLKALRSDDYQQTHGYLCRYRKGVPSFCCLGVLAVVQGEKPERLVDRQILDEVGLQTLLQPNSIMWGKIENHLGIEPISLQQLLATKNDDGKSFAQIADWIEANL